MKRATRNKIETSSGNVFRDLDYVDAEEALAKSRLAQRVSQIIKKNNLTQIQAATTLGIDQPKISRLLRGQLQDFSTERLFRFLIALNQDVQITVQENPRANQQAQLIVRTGSD